PTLLWVHGQGFPKALSVGKALDKAAGAEREVVFSYEREGRQAGIMGKKVHITRDVTVPATSDAATWDGWSSSLKPAWECILMFRKPMSCTLAENALKWGVAGLNIDGCRIGTQGEHVSAGTPNSIRRGTFNEHEGYQRPWKKNDPELHAQRCDEALERTNRLGRWPANLILSHSPGCQQVGVKQVKGYTINRWDDGAKPFGGGAGHEFTSEPQGDETVELWECEPDCAVRMLDEQSGERKSGSGDKHGRKASTFCASTDWEQFKGTSIGGDTGGASRFFKRFPPDTESTRFLYCAKASRAEREAGLDGKAEPKRRFASGGRTQIEGQWVETYSKPIPMCNRHPTVKPLKLMEYLCRLTKTPTGGVVLDPFMGSGTTGIASHNEGRKFIGIEMEKDYFEIALVRIRGKIKPTGRLF
ncbi:site-specific DNA-methyltransferase, partial [Candidatus Bathyarchaeota archaeon]|nr:site-specific DNA-methyltransferase [Candidatus Bathyarchaeota archaeon]